MSLCIAINGRFQHRRISGVERYAHEISKRLQTPKRFVSPKKPLGQFSGHLWEQFILPTLIKKDEILWSPANTSAWNVSKQVLTIHDASVFDHPEWFRPAFAAWTRLSWKMLARKSKAIITVSDFSKQRLQHHLNIPNEKIRVAYNGVGKPFEPQSINNIEKVKEKYGIKRPYFLFVGTMEPRKNLGALLEAWQLLGLGTHELIITGAEGKVFARVNNPANHAIRVSDEDLPSMYSGATAFVNPSHYEGFGLTLLEAMACGTPVIASNTTVFPEFFGDTALLVNPHKPKDIANAMQKIVEDKTLSTKLRELGLQKAAQFSWENSAKKTQSILESIA
jgi:glycosyltransferase involved in cell wall biosynthesis